MNSFIQNLKVFWGQLGVNQRVSLTVSVVFVLILTVGLFLWSQRPDMRLLYGSVAAKDAAAIVEHLESEGIPYELRSGGSSIFVPAKFVYEVRMDVASQGFIQGDSVGFEIFDKNSFGISDFIQKTNFIRAVQGELARTIKHLDGVHNARVMVVMPDNKLLLVNKNVETTASVFVDVGGGKLAPDAVSSIQALVANAVEGLKKTNVAVVDNRGTVLSREEDPDSMLSGSMGIVEYRQQLENYFSKKVESMLEHVVGLGNAVVRVSAAIDTAQTTRMVEDFNEDGAVLRKQSSREEATTKTEGRGDTVSLEVDENAASTASNNSRTDEESLDRQQEYEIGRTLTNTIEGPGSVRKLTASVFVASRLEAPSTGEGEPVPINRTEEELEGLREMVANALGISLDDPSTGSVAVQEVLFDVPEIPEISTENASVFELSQLMSMAEEIIGGVIALVLFILFLTFLKRSGNQDNLFEMMSQSRRSIARNAESTHTEMLTPEILNELISQKPENAGAALRNWLSGNSSE